MSCRSCGCESVIPRECNGKHGLYALHILRNLILHGPLAAVAEATDGLDKIRALKSHSDSLRSKQAQQVREAVTQVYSLLVDRAMLFWARRVCANARRVMKNPPQGSLKRDSRLRVNIPFQNIHAAMAPTGHRPSAAPYPPPQPARHPGHAQGRGHPQQQRPPAVANPVVDLLGIAAPAEPGKTVAQVQQQSNNVLGMFDSMSVSGSSATSTPPPAFAQQPTIAQLPPPTSSRPTASAPPAFAQPPAESRAPTTSAAAPPNQPRYTQQQPPGAGPVRPVGYSQQHQQPAQPSRSPAPPQPTFAQIPPKTLQPMVAVQQAPPPSAYASSAPRQQPPAAYNPQQAGPPQYNPQGGQASAFAGQPQYPPPQQQQAYVQTPHQQPGFTAPPPQLLPGQQPPATTNLFAAAAPPATAPAPAAPKQSKFDPLRKDPFA